MSYSLLSDGEVVRLALEAFRDAPEPWQSPETLLRAEADFGGDDALYVTAVFPNEVPHLNGSQRVDIQIALGDLLIAHNDHRLVYLSVLTRSDLKALRALEAETPSDAA